MFRKKVEERLLEKCKHNPETGCWEWTACINPTGYGQFKYRGSKKGAHVVSHNLFIGDPGELYVCHLCNNKKCVNPDHLYLDTHRGNIEAARRDGLYKKGKEHHNYKHGKTPLGHAEYVRAWRKDNPGKQAEYTRNSKRKKLKCQRK